MPVEVVLTVELVAAMTNDHARLDKIRKFIASRWGLIVGSLLALAVLTFVLGTYWLNESDLPFESIAQADGFYSGQSYEGEEPNLLIVAKLEEVDMPGLGIQFPTRLADQLHTLDYNRYFAILVLQGLKGTSGHKVTVQRIGRRDNRITVQAHFATPPPGSIQTQAFTSPYHLVVVSKDTVLGNEVRFVLRADDRIVAWTTHIIPSSVDASGSPDLLLAVRTL